MTSAKLHSFVILVLFLVLGYTSQAQVTKIFGIVTDANTGEPVPFANIILKGTAVGAVSTFEGTFSIETRETGFDTLLVSFIGYHTFKTGITQNIYQEIRAELQPNEFTLSEVEIFSGENPAEIIFRKIIANKEINNKQNFEAYQYEAYTKVQFDINNITEKTKNSKIFKPFEFVYEYIDTSTVNGKPYLPFFISESIADVYFQKEPKAKKEYVKATKIAGPQNESISQFLGDLYQNVNIYDNYIQLFDKNFVSPIANFGLTYYEYYLLDSLFINSKWCYQLKFKPRRKQEMTFSGEFWVNDSNWAIKKVNMSIIEDANINFIHNIVLKQDYDKIDNKYWMLTRDFMLADFNVYDNPKKALGFFGHKTTCYKDFIFDQKKSREFYNTVLDIYVEDGSFEKTDIYWEDSRHESLTQKEESIYQMVDSIKRLPAVQSWIDAFYLLTEGYWGWGGPIELGPLNKIMSFNPVEGTRIRVGGRTTKQFSENLMIYGHLAYGFKDDRFKYGLGTKYTLSRNPARSIHISFLNDLEQLGKSPDAPGTDNLLSAVFRRTPADKLSMVQQSKISYEHEWFPGFSNTINLIHRDISPYGSTEFIIREDDHIIVKNSITTFEIRLDARFAFKEKYLSGQFKRISLGSKYPIVEAHYSYGIPGILNGEYKYQKLQIGLSHWFNVSTFGWSKYIIKAGKIWGTLPYPLLEMHPGNETFIFDKLAYNLMNYYEFISDRYLHIFYTHHFDGLLFNHIPLLRKLKWREVVFIQGAWGSLTPQNRAYSLFPPGTYTLEKPYIESGVGIENIFKVLRIDAVWRLTNLHHPGIKRFAVFFSYQFSF